MMRCTVNNIEKVETKQYLNKEPYYCLVTLKDKHTVGGFIKNTTLNGNQGIRKSVQKFIDCATLEKTVGCGNNVYKHIYKMF